MNILLASLKALHTRASTLEVEMAMKTTEVEQLRQLFHSSIESKGATRPATPLQPVLSSLNYRTPQNGSLQYPSVTHTPDYAFGMPSMGSALGYGPGSTPATLSHSYSYPGRYPYPQLEGVYDSGCALSTFAEIENLPRPNGVVSPSTSPQRSQRASFSIEQPFHKLPARQRGSSMSAFPTLSNQPSRSPSVSSRLASTVGRL